VKKENRLEISYKSYSKEQKILYNLSKISIKKNLGIGCYMKIRRDIEISEINSTFSVLGGKLHGPNSNKKSSTRSEYELPKVANRK